jgi:DUF1009 family protein
VSAGAAVTDAPADPVAIVCGAGVFPFAVADAASRRGRRVVLFALRGWADPQLVARFPHHWFALGQTATVIRHAREEGCRDFVFIGSLVRPSIRQLRMDFTTLRLLPRIFRLFRGGDNHLLSGLGQILEEQGLRVVGAHEIAPEILVPAGVLGRHRPSARDMADVALGGSLLDRMGPFDIGQAVVIADRRVLAIEAAEGTDQMLARVATMRAEGRISLPGPMGVLVKAPKPQQDRRYDLPSVGARTVDAAAKAGVAGIAVEAGGAISADLQDLIRAADAAGLFFIGFDRTRLGAQT